MFVGSGVQLLLMCIATLSFALLGLLSPANRGSLVTAFILLFVFMGSFAGYYSSMTYKVCSVNPLLYLKFESVQDIATGSMASDVII